VADRTEYVSLLRAHGVNPFVDVRTLPRSRHNPQFNADVLPGTLAASRSATPGRLAQPVVPQCDAEHMQSAGSTTPSST
jgi:hypothetical protein